jgi:ElaB/YqjD/DUF883 family membrane-anchored ribosome-binding protein
MSDSIRKTLENGADSVGAELRSGAESVSKYVRGGIESGRDLLDDGAGSVGDAVREVRKNVRGANRRVASALTESGDYFRTNGPRAVLRDVEELINEHPGKAMLAAAALAFLIGRGMKRRG